MVFGEVECEGHNHITKGGVEGMNRCGPQIAPANSIKKNGRVVEFEK